MYDVAQREKKEECKRRQLKCEKKAMDREREKERLSK